MEILRRDKIDFENLERLDYKNATESTLYVGNGILYKEYLNFLSAQKKRRKLELLYNGGTISNTVIPYALITDNFFFLVVL